MTCYYSNDDFLSSYLPMATPTVSQRRQQNVIEEDEIEFVKKPSNIFESTFRGHTLIVGATNSGKTTIIFRLIRNGIVNNKRILWVCSREFSPNERDILVSKLSVHGAKISIAAIRNTEQLSNLLNVAGNACRKSDEGPLLIVLDDMMSITNGNIEFEEICSAGRHYNIQLITTYQAIHNRRSNWNMSKSGATQLIITRLGAQTNTVTTILAQYLSGHTGISERNIQIRNIALSLLKNEVLNVPYGSLLIINRPDRPFDSSMIRTNFYDNKRQYCYDISNDGNTYIKKIASKISGTKDKFKILDENVDSEIEDDETENRNRINGESRKRESDRRIEKINDNSEKGNYCKKRPRKLQRRIIDGSRFNNEKQRDSDGSNSESDTDFEPDFKRKYTARWPPTDFIDTKNGDIYSGD